MVLSVFLHMARVFYHCAYKPPREFNWVIGVVLLMLTLLLSFTGYLLPWDQLALCAVTVGTNMMGYTPVFITQVRFVLLGGGEIGTDTLLRWYVPHVLLLPFMLVIFMAIHFGGFAKMAGSPDPCKQGRLGGGGRSVVLGVDEFRNIWGWRAGLRQLLGSTVAQVEPCCCADQADYDEQCNEPAPPPSPSASASTWLTSGRTATTEEVTTVAA